MQGKTLQLPILLPGLALIFLSGFSRAKYIPVGGDDEISAMNVAADKGIPCIFVPIENQILSLFLNGIRVCIFLAFIVCNMSFQMKQNSQQSSGRSFPLLDLEVLVEVVTKNVNQ